jgi:uncharacterized protein YjbI with pentapeptide repeats
VDGVDVDGVDVDGVDVDGVDVDVDGVDVDDANFRSVQLSDWGFLYWHFVVFNISYLALKFCQNRRIAASSLYGSRSISINYYSIRFDHS